MFRIANGFSNIWLTNCPLRDVHGQMMGMNEILRQDKTDMMRLKLIFECEFGFVADEKV